MRRTGLTRPATRLRLQSLETRQLMAAAAFELQLYSDVDGAPGAPIESVVAGETFFVRITAEEFDPRRFGLGSAAVDVDWDAGLLQVVEGDFVLADVLTEDLPLGQQGELDNAAGRIDELGGLAMISAGAGRAIGNMQADTLAMIRMQAGSQAGSATIRLSASDTKTITVPSRVLPESLVDYGTLTLAIDAPTFRDAAELATAPPHFDPPPLDPPAVVVEGEPDVDAVETVEAAGDNSASGDSLPPAPVAVDDALTIDANHDGVVDLADFGALNVLSTADETSSHSPSVCTPRPQAAADVQSWLDALTQAWLDDAERRRQRAA